MIAKTTADSGCPICRAVDQIFSHTGLTPNTIVGSAVALDPDLSTWCTKHRIWAAEMKREIEGTAREEDE